MNKKEAKLPFWLKSWRKTRKKNLRRALKENPDIERRLAAIRDQLRPR
jgi:hypothetical protein